MKLSRLAITVLGAFALMFGVVAFGPRQSEAAPKAGPVTFNNISVPTATGGTFIGSVTIDRLVNQGGQLMAVGSVTGTVTDSLGTVLGTVSGQSFTAPAAATGSCQILDLVLGPLHLDLLGLVVDLNQVHLNITAQQGSGNLLGNLLCAVAGLLDGNSSTNAIANLLNHILSLLG